MGKDFLKLKSDSKRMYIILLGGGLLLTILMGIRSYQDSRLPGGNELPKNDSLQGAYEQELFAYVGDEKVPLSVTVEERVLSQEEAELQFSKAEELLPELIKGENESLSKVTGNLNLIEQIPDMAVEVTWTEIPWEYFYTDGTIREELEVFEPVELKLSAVLYCQEYAKDYEAVLTLLPRTPDVEQQILRQISNVQEQSPESGTLILPDKYEGSPIRWRKPLDMTFLWLFALTIGAAFLLKAGEKRDEGEAKKLRLEELEKEYAQIVGKFSMLLSAGLSVRNAWERIVVLYRKRGSEESVIFQELSWALNEMQKGISELEVYEAFGVRTGLVHYKKLMALFVSDKRRGSVRLLDAMNQEMMSAFEEQKRKTRQQGEKIGTKLLLPMMGMLGVVFIIILVPALLSFQL